jgi:hypothetical protein
MKTRNLLITLSVAALATVNVMAADALLSPRATDMQIKIVQATDNSPNLAAARPTSVSPHLLDNSSKTVTGQSTGASPSLACVRNMAGTPKEISACADHPGLPMPCCAVAATK